MGRTIRASCPPPAQTTLNTCNREGPKLDASMPSWQRTPSLLAVLDPRHAFFLQRLKVDRQGV